MSAALARGQLAKGWAKVGPKVGHACAARFQSDLVSSQAVCVILWLPAYCFINPLPPIPTYLGQYLQAYPNSPLRLAC